MGAEVSAVGNPAKMGREGLQGIVNFSDRRPKGAGLRPRQSLPYPDLFAGRKRNFVYGRSFARRYGVYSTVTLLAKLRGLSTSQPRKTAI